MAVTIPNGQLQYLFELEAAEVTTWGVALLGTGFTPNADTHEFMDDISAELSGNGYARKELILATGSPVQDNANDKSYYDFQDVEFTGIIGSLTFQTIVVFDNTNGADSSRRIKSMIKLASSQTVSDDFTLTIPSGGLFEITQG